MLAARGILLAGGDKMLVSVLAHDLQQAVARAPGALERNQRLVHEVREQVHHVVFDRLRVRGDGLDGLQGAAAAEHREPAQQHALRRREQRVAPVERRAQRLLVRQRGLVAFGEEPHAVVQPRGDVVDRERAHARGGELDRERDALEPPADLAYGPGIPGRDAESRFHRRGALDEEAHRFAGRDLVERVRAERIGNGERRHRKLRFAGDPQRLAARGENGQAGRRLQQLPRERRAGLHEMLAVVEDQEHAPALQVLHQRLDYGAPGFLLHPEHKRDHLRDARCLREGRELHQPHAVGVEREHVPGDFEREPRLSGAADAGERDKARSAQHRRDAADLALAPDEAAERGGNVVVIPGRRGLPLLGLGTQGEAVAAPGNGRHRMRTEDLAQRRDLHLEVVLLDHQAWPDAIEELVLGHDALAGIDEGEKHVEGAGAEHRGAAIDQHLPFGGPDLHRAKAIGLRQGTPFGRENRADAAQMLPGPPV
jgi:hypothetical protein